MLIAWPAFIGIERVVGYLYSSCDKGRLLLAHKKEQFALYIRPYYEFLVGKENRIRNPFETIVKIVVFAYEKLLEKISEDEE